MVNWTKFDPSEVAIEFNELKLAAHGIEIEEAEELLHNDFRPIRDKHFKDRYLLYGRTDAGRPLTLVAEDLGKHRIRIVTGWQL